MTEYKNLETQLADLAKYFARLQDHVVPDATQAGAAYKPLAALLAVIQFLEAQPLFKLSGAVRLTDPLWGLLIAVSELESGVAHPMLTPAKPGKRTTATERQALQAWAAIACDAMQKAGRVRAAAGDEVAEHLTSVKLSRGSTLAGVTGATVLGWLNTVRRKTAAPGTMYAWRIYIQRREAEPETLPEEWVDRAVGSMKEFVAGRLIIVSPPAKVEH